MLGQICNVQIIKNMNDVLDLANELSKESTSFSILLILKW